MKKIVGLDLSTSSPGITELLLDDNYDIISFKIYGFSSNKESIIDSDNMKIEYISSKFKSMILYDRMSYFSTYITEICKDATLVGIEGYSYGTSQASSIVQLAEFNGLIKYVLYNLKIPFILYPPTSIKRFAVGSGKADKVLMCGGHKTQYPQYYPEHFNNLKQYGSPHSDMCDSFWISYLLYSHVLYSKVPTKLDDETKELLEFSTKDNNSIVEAKIVYKDDSEEISSKKLDDANTRNVKKSKKKTKKEP